MPSKTVLLCLCRMEFYLRGNGDQALPFELQAFEVPLAAAVRLFESETNALEGKLLPSLERLTAKVSLHTGYTTKTVELQSNDPGHVLHAAAERSPQLARLLIPKHYCIVTTHTSSGASCNQGIHVLHCSA
jgi:hypothetical protein